MQADCMASGCMHGYACMHPSESITVPSGVLLRAPADMCRHGAARLLHDAGHHGRWRTNESPCCFCVQLILSLIDNWQLTDGVDQIVKWSGTASSHEAFFSDANCMQLYRDTAAAILNRVNSINGRRCACARLPCSS